MPTIDLSRFATDFRKQYDSVRMFQGAVLNEDDFNENIRLDQEYERRTRVHVIGPAGSPDSGFQIANPAVAGGVATFQIASGNFYLGGLHLQMSEAEAYHTQRDWLRADPIPPPPAAGRYDLVYLEAFQQPVGDVEDGELAEVALGGVSTSARIRTMRRIRVLPLSATPADCQQAWAALLTARASEGTLSGEHELVPNVTLTVDFDPDGVSDDLCTPPVAGGYLGAENQAIRVQLVDSTHFTWGFDNAAPLYRVRVGTNSAGQRRVITMMNEPRDVAHWPLGGQVVELLPWSAVLVNGQKLAEVSGLLAKVDASYNPDLQRFTIAASVPAGFGEEWKTRPDAASLAEDGEYFYLRVWNRGSDTASPAAIPFTSGVPLPLAQTGLRVTIADSHRPANGFWIIAARPDSPSRVVPWALESGRSPHGYRRFYAPLAVIRWQNSTTGQVVQDCRLTFPPLTRPRTCCTYTVGDGAKSHGHFHSIQEAIDHLPAAGGHICVLAGMYHEHIRIAGRQDISIQGCGARTIVTARQPDLPVFSIEDSQRITIRSLAINAPDSLGVALRSTTPQRPALQGVTLSELQILSSDSSAIECRGGRDIRILENHIVAFQLREALKNASVKGRVPAVFVGADEVLIEGNRILGRSVEGRALLPLGGLQIGGGSERVEIRRNRIVGGNGNGITLGSIVFATPGLIQGIATGPGAQLVKKLAVAPSFIIFVDSSGCIHLFPSGKAPQPPAAGPPPVPLSEGELRHVRIVDNEIADMGSSGIASVQFLNGTKGVLSIHDLTIEHNHIHDCVQLQLEDAQLNTPVEGFGGIAIRHAEHLAIRSNRIQKCGALHSDPTCGVYAREIYGVAIENNLITDNGPRGRLTRLVRGPRGGIIIGRARVPPEEHSEGLPVEIGRSAARVHENVVVSPIGRAVEISAIGPVSIHGNHLASRGVVPEPPAVPVPGPIIIKPPPIEGLVVWVTNLGLSAEIFGKPVTVSGMGTLQPAFPAGSIVSAINLAAIAQPAVLTTGFVMFNDNQVFLRTDERRLAATRYGVALVSRDDVEMAGNQIRCETREVLIAGATAVGWSTRVTSNRFKEVPGRAVFSALTNGRLNSTVDNHGTHCIRASGTLTTTKPNHSVIQLVNPTACP
jgi:hypothetical protein